MADKRMFSQAIISSDKFLDLPQSTQLLYFHLGMRARDKGILNNCISIARTISCTKHDIHNLINSKFIKEIDDEKFEIIHWYENNGIGETAKKRNNHKYRKWRLTILERDKYTCRFCLKKEKIMHVHHIQPFAIHEDLRFNVDNGITLCPSCHKEEHRRMKENGTS